MTIKYGADDLERDIGGLTFGKLIEAHRKCDEYSLKEYAKILGISTSSLCDLEKGRKIPSAKRAASIAKALEMSEKFFVQLALQDQLNEQGIDLKVSVA